MDSPNVGKVPPTPISASTATEKTGVKPQITDNVSRFTELREQFTKQCATRTAAFATGPPSLEVWIAAIQDSIDNLNLQKGGAGRGKRGGDNEKADMCFYFERGTCKRGDSCRFSHDGGGGGGGRV